MKKDKLTESRLPDMDRRFRKQLVNTTKILICASPHSHANRNHSEIAFHFHQTQKCTVSENTAAHAHSYTVWWKLSLIQGLWSTPSGPVGPRQPACSGAVPSPAARPRKTHPCGKAGVCKSSRQHPHDRKKSYWLWVKNGPKNCIIFIWWDIR